MTIQWNAHKQYHLFTISEPISKAVITEELDDHTCLYSLGEKTDLAVMRTIYDRFVYVVQGAVEFVLTSDTGEKSTQITKEGQMIILPRNMPIGVKTLKDTMMIRTNVINETDFHPSLFSFHTYDLMRLLPIHKYGMNVMHLIDNMRLKISLMVVDAHTSTLEKSEESQLFITPINGDGTIRTDAHTVPLKQTETCGLTPFQKYTIKASEKPFHALLFHKSS